MTDWLLKVLPPRFHGIVIEYGFLFLPVIGLLIFAIVFFAFVDSQADLEVQGHYRLQVIEKTEDVATASTNVVARAATGEDYNLTTKSPSMAEEAQDTVCAARLIRKNGNVTYRWVDADKCEP